MELARQANLVSQVETLNNQIIEMETLITDMKTKNNITSIPSPNFSMPSLVDDSDRSVMSSSAEEDINSVSCIASSVTDSAKVSTKRRRLLLDSEKNHTDIDAYLTPTITDEKQENNYQQNAAPWTLTFKKGQVCIETKVVTHTDLLNNLYHMMGTVELMPAIPPLFKSELLHNTMMGVLNAIVRFNYGKTHCRNVARSVHIFITPNVSNIDTLSVYKSPDSIQTTTLKLLNAYFKCQHLQHLAIHVRTFIRLFMQDERESPAVMALCAAICTMRCKHVADCLPSISLIEYGAFYFEKARDLLSDFFDQLNLEMLTSYTFMAMYKLAVSQNNESSFYADMAERIMSILMPHYQASLHDSNNEDALKGEAVHFFRLKNHLHRCMTYQEITLAINARGKLAPQKRETLPFCTIFNRQEGRYEIAEDDSQQEKMFAQMHTYIVQLQRLQHEASRSAESFDLQHLVGLVGHQVEMAIRHWYNDILPSNFKLSLPLFDSTMGCRVFFDTVKRECEHTIIPVLTTMAAYEECITLGQSYLPKKKADAEHDWGRLTEVWNGGKKALASGSVKWQRRIDKLMLFRRDIQFDGTDEEYLLAVNSMLAPAEESLESNTVFIGVHAAFNMIRLIKFLRSREQDCYFDMRYLMSAWHFLLRVSRLKTVLKEEIKVLIPRVRKNLNTCMEIVKDEAQSQPYQGMVSSYVAQMEDDLKNELIDDDDCDCAVCPGA